MWNAWFGSRLIQTHHVVIQYTTVFKTLRVILQKICVWIGPVVLWSILLLSNFCYICAMCKCKKHSLWVGFTVNKLWKLVRVFKRDFCLHWKSYIFRQTTSYVDYSEHIWILFVLRKTHEMFVLSNRQIFRSFNYFKKEISTSRISVLVVKSYNFKKPLLCKTFCFYIKKKIFTIIFYELKQKTNGPI